MKNFQMFNKIDAMNLIFVIIIHIKASYSGTKYAILSL